MAEPLIITSNDPKVGTAREDIEVNVQQGVDAAEAGAAILHHHVIYASDEPGRKPVLDVGASKEMISALRAKTDAIFQLGITLATDDSRMAVAKAIPVDMFSITLADNDHYGRVPSVHRNRDEMEILAKFCLDNGITPEWEIFHSGAVWNLHYLIKKGLAKPPYVINLCMYPEGSCWSPKSFAELDYRVSLLPEGCEWHLVAFAKGVADPVIPTISTIDHARLLTYATLKGGHVRTGREDRPEIRPGVPAETNAELVREIAEISTLLGRPPATPEQARRTLKIGER